MANLTVLNIHVNAVRHLILLLRALTGYNSGIFLMHFVGQRRQANNHVVRSQVTLLRCSNKRLIVVPWRNGCSNWKESRTIQNWDQFRKKWVTVIHNSKLSHISWCPPPRAPFFPLPCWSSSFAAGCDVLLRKRQPAPHPLQIQAVVSWSAAKKTWRVKFSSLVAP